MDKKLKFLISLILIPKSKKEVKVKAPIETTTSEQIKEEIKEIAKLSPEEQELEKMKLQIKIIFVKFNHITFCFGCFPIHMDFQHIR